MKKSVYKPAMLIAFSMAAMHVHVARADPGQAVGKVGVPATLPVADGEVEDIDMANRYVILKHGPIANLNMEAMTMAFGVKEATMLTRLKVGDKVKFTAKDVRDVPTIMSLRVQQSSDKEQVDLPVRPTAPVSSRTN